MRAGARCSAIGSYCSPIQNGGILSPFTSIFTATRAPASARRIRPAGRHSSPSSYNRAAPRQSTSGMALVVFLRGVNVGGHRRFRPSVLAKALSAYDVTNVGAAGTFVVRQQGTRAKFLAELRQRL